MGVNIEFSKCAEQADNIINALREKAQRRCSVEISKANAYCTGYTEALLDIQEAILKYRMVNKEEGVQGETA